MQTKGSRLSDQQGDVRASQALDDRTGGAWRGIEDHKARAIPPCSCSVALERPNHGRGHRLAYVERALREDYAPCTARLDEPNWLGHLADSLGGAFQRTTAATVTQLLEDQHLPRDHSQGVILANLSAASTVVTARCVHHRNEPLDYHPFVKGGL